MRCGDCTETMDDVTFLSHFRRGGLGLIQWQVPTDQNQTDEEATMSDRKLPRQADSSKGDCPTR